MLATSGERSLSRGCRLARVRPALDGYAADEAKALDIELLQNFAARDEHEHERALLRRVVLLRSAEGVDIDIALGALPFEENCVCRATPWKIGPELTLTTCSAEDLIVHKAFAARDRDWSDIQRVVMRHGRKLNVPQVWHELRPLVELKEEPEILTRLQRIFDQHLDD